MPLNQNLRLAPLNDTQWNDKFALWRRPPTDSEEERIQRAARMIRDVVHADPNIAKHNVEVLPQGSYHNNTNVRLNSDLDLCIRYGDRCWWYAAPELNITASDLNVTPLLPGTLEATARWLKNTLFEGLRLRFGAHNVEWGNKALKVRGLEGSRVDADVVPAVGYWLARQLLPGFPSVEKGTAIYTDDGRWIVNFPEQHYERGKAKNESTGRRYKSVVRILKQLSDDLNLLNPPPSFLIESLVYNYPDELFPGDNWYETIWRVLAWVYYVTSKPTVAGALVEANGINPLFVGGQPWTVQQANSFALAASLKIS